MTSLAEQYPVEQARVREVLGLSVFEDDTT